MKETWKGMIYNNIDYSNYLMVSNLGYIFSKRTNKILKTCINSRGYHRFVTTIDGNKINFGLHRAVACTFIPNPDNLPEVNHIDGNKDHNQADNLEWVTKAYNGTHALQHKLVDNNGINNEQSKLTEYQVQEIRKIRQEENLSYRNIAKIFKVSHVTIINVCKHRTYK